jgi:soluble lytic murein transglycosylase-like protein
MNVSPVLVYVRGVGSSAFTRARSKLEARHVVVTMSIWVALSSAPSQARELPGDDWSSLDQAAEAVQRLDDDAALPILGRIEASTIDAVKAAANHMLARLHARRGQAALARRAFDASGFIGTISQDARTYAEVDVLVAEGRLADAHRLLSTLRQRSPEFRTHEAALRKSRLDEKVLSPKAAASAALATIELSRIRLPVDELLDRAARLTATYDAVAAAKLDRRLVLSYPESELADAALTRMGGLARLSNRDRFDRVEKLFEHRAYEACREEAMWLWQRGLYMDRVGYFLGKIGSERLRDDPRGAALYFGPASAPDAPEARKSLLSLALALGKTGQTDSALKTFDLWLARYGDVPLAEGAEKRFREPIVQVTAPITELVEAHYDRARLLHPVGKSAQAARDLETFLGTHKGGFDHGKYSWFIGFWRFQAGDMAGAIRSMRRLLGSPNALVGGKARYWIGRAQEQQGSRAAAIQTWRELILKFPLTYYAALAEWRLAELSEPVASLGPFGPPPPPLVWSSLPQSAEVLAIRVASHLGEPDVGRAVFGKLKGPLTRQLGAATFAQLDASLAEPLEAWASRRSEARRKYGKAVRSAPTAETVAAWRAVYPRAYGTHVAPAARLNQVPEWMVYAHMLQESRFKPWMISGAPAFGLVELLDRTGRRLAGEMKDDYQRWMLLEPKWNLRWATRYLGALVHKYDGHLPLAVGAYNGGPRLMNALLERTRDPKTPFDVFVEDIPTHESRNYLRKVIEHMIRYAAIWAPPSEAKALREQLFRTPWRGRIRPEPDY